MKLGILGPGRIARTVAATLVQMPEIECYAVASRNRERAAEFAKDFGFVKQGIAMMKKVIYTNTGWKSC